VYINVILMLLLLNSDVKLGLRQPIDPPPTPLTIDLLEVDDQNSQISWNNIIIGQTTLADAEVILDNLNFYTSSTRVTEDQRGEHVETTITRWGNVHDSKYQRVGITSTDGVVSSVDVIPFEIFTLSDIIDVYGTPDAVTIEPSSSGGIVSYDVRIMLLYSRMGFIAEFTLFHGTEFFYEVTISPDVELDAFRILSQQNDLETFARNGYALRQLTMEGWPGINTTLLFDRHRYRSFPAVITADGEVCCDLQTQDTLPRWLIFEIINNDA
jgi:hypothetical protein